MFMIDFQHIAYTLCGILFTWTIYEVRELKKSSSDQEKRIQHIEDLHGRDIDEIKKILQELSAEVKALTRYIHKDNHDMIEIFKQQSDIILRMHKDTNETK